MHCEHFLKREISRSNLIGLHCFIYISMAYWVTVNARYNEVIRKLYVPSTISLRLLENKVNELFGVQNCALKYGEDDHDERELVTMGSQDDLDKALIVTQRGQPSGQPVVLNLQVSTNQHPTPTSIENRNYVVKEEKMATNSQASARTVFKEKKPDSNGCFGNLVTAIGPQLAALNIARTPVDQAPEVANGESGDAPMDLVNGHTDTSADQTQAQSKRSKTRQRKKKSKKPKKLGCYGDLAAAIAPELAALPVPAREPEPVNTQSREPEVHEDDRVINVRNNPEFAAQMIGPVQEDQPCMVVETDKPTASLKGSVVADSSGVSLDAEVMDVVEKEKDTIITHPTDDMQEQEPPLESAARAYEGVNSVVPVVADENVKRPYQPSKPKRCYVGLAELVGPQLAALNVQNEENPGTEHAPVAQHSGTAMEQDGPAIN